MSILRKSNKKASSRQQINIKGVRDGVLLLPGNQYRVVLKASSINFELKSDEEQDAIVETYQSFLNSLVSPVQIIVRIREMDLKKYLNDFRAALDNEADAVYHQQILNYSEFVQQLVSTNKILSRQFYVVVPFVGNEKTDFETVREQLTLHAEIVAKGLERTGIQTRRLDALELLDLFYSFYNPAQAKRQPLAQQTIQLLNQAHY